MSDQGTADFDPSITSFLCTDAARKIFEDAAKKFDNLTLNHRDWKFSHKPDSWDVFTNAQCLAHAKDFYNYADIEGYPGSPHKL